MRDHQPYQVPGFNGLWKRGTADSCPPDHFSDVNNVDYIEGGFRTRGGINPFLPYSEVIRVYDYRKPESESLLVLDVDGNLFDSGSPTPFIPILTISGMLDFGLVIIAGRAYISPCTKVHGMAGEFLYVYLGDGTPARKAAGNPPTDADGAMAAANSGSAGNVEAGFRIFGVVYETDTGYLTAPGPDTFPTLTSPGAEKVDLSSIPVSPSAAVVKRHIVATRAIIGYTGQQDGYTFYFVPNGTIADNTTTTLSVSFFDAELIDDASHLIDNYSEIPAGVGLTLYNNRLCNYTQNTDQSQILVSQPGEPEAISQIDGLVLLQRDDQPITVCAELRGVLYAYKNTRTFGVTDNGDVPSAWPVIPIDLGLGASYRGVASVLEGGSVTAEVFIITNFSGVYIFDGKFNLPELSWKISELWLGILIGSPFLNMQIYIDTIKKYIYLILPDEEQLLFGNYSNGLSAEKIRWGIWTFDVEITTICLTQFNVLVIGSREEL